MSVMLAFFQLLFIALICIYEVKRKSSVVFLWATLLVMFGIMHFLSVLIGKSEYTTNVLDEASLFVILFCSVYILVRYVMCNSKRDTYFIFSYDSICKQAIRNHGTMIFVLFCGAVFLLLWKFVAFSGGILNTSWGAGRNYTASLGYANSNQVGYILFFSLAGVPLFFYIFRQKAKMIFCILFILALVLITRNRITVVPILVCIISVFVFKIRKLKLSHLVIATLGAVGVIYLVYGLRVMRHYGTLENFINTASFVDVVEKINLYIITDNGELGLRNDFYHFIKYDNKFDGFGEGASYVRMLLVYIPTRFSFGLKPDDFAITMGTACGGSNGYSTHPTLFGDCYANLGWFGILLGAFWALYASVADYITVRFKHILFKILAFCLFASMYVLMGRGSVYNSFFYVAYGVPVLCALSYVHRRLPHIKFSLTTKYTIKK